MLASTVSRASALAIQVIAGLYLSEREFGAFAAALGLLGVASILRSGGAAYFMQSMTPAELQAEGRQYFWWSALFLAGSGAVMFAAGFSPHVQAWAVGSDATDLRNMPAVLAWLGVRQILTPVSQLGRLRLAAQHRFSELATLDAINSVIRVGVAVALASQGFGVLSLAIPYTLQTAIEFIWVLASKNVGRWNLFPPGFPPASKLKNLIWPSITSIFNAVNQQINLLILARAVPLATVGEFYFAAQIASQPMVLLPSALQGVLAPLMAANRHSQQAARDLAGSVLRGALLFAPITTLAAASLFPSVEQIVWGGRWSKLQFPMFLLCAGVSYATTAALMIGPMIGLRQYKAAALIEGSRAVTTAASTILGAWLAKGGRPEWAASIPEVTIVSAAFGAGLVMSSIAQLAWIASRLGIDRRTLGRDLLFGPSLAALTALAAQSVGSSVMASLDMAPSRFSYSVNAVVVAVVYLALITLSVRFTAEAALRDMMLVVPAGVRRPLERLLRL